MFCSTFAFSTLAQFGLVGTNQLNFAARANGASFGFDALSASSFVVLAMLPALRSQSRPRAGERLDPVHGEALVLRRHGTARSEPPRNVGMYLPFEWLGIG
jgi:hypothetical protein